jgi:hypothetical protein
MVPRECAFRATVVAESVPRLSCTVVLLMLPHPHTHVTKYVLVQHYFTVPLQTQETVTDPNDAMMRMWYVSVPFEVVCMTDRAEEDEEDTQTFHQVTSGRVG